MPEVFRHLCILVEVLGATDGARMQSHEVVGEHHPHGAPISRFDNLDQALEAGAMGMLLAEVAAYPPDDVAIVLRPPDHIDDLLLGTLIWQPKLQRLGPVEKPDVRLVQQEQRNRASGWRFEKARREQQNLREGG